MNEMINARRIGGIPFDGISKEHSFTAVLGIISVYVFIFWLVIPGLLFSLGFRLDLLLPVTLEQSPSLGYLALSLIIIGSVIVAAAIVQLWFQGKGLPISHLPPSEFVVKGIYRFLRHPVYFGYTILFIGLSLACDSFWSLCFSAPLLTAGWVMYARFYEEPVLLARFGEEYREYMSKVGLFCPKFRKPALERIWKPINKAYYRVSNVFANYTICFRYRNIIFVTYGALIAIGCALFMQLFSALFMQIGSGNLIFGYFLGAIFSTAFVSRIFWWLGNWRKMIQQPLWGLRNVGFVSWGGLTGLLLYTVIFAWINGYPALLLTDIVVRTIFIAYALGRIGCLTYGCCWGMNSHKEGIIYENPHAKVIRVNGECNGMRYPVQMWSFFEGIILFILLNILAYFPTPEGIITVAGALLYPIGRAYIEFFRDRRRYIRGIFTDGHIGCGALFAVGCLLLFFGIDTICVPGVAPILSIRAVSASLIHTPAIIGLSALIFIITGFHWKKVGTW